jgi:galactonate dehydratase
MVNRKLRVTGLEIIPVRVSDRTRWLFVRLSTDVGLQGIGEASLGRAEGLDELDTFFELVRDRSPFEIQRYRERGRAIAAAGGLRAATAFSAIEQALWDLTGKALDAPVHQLLGGALRDTVPVYANVNRMTVDRCPEGFARSAVLAVENGFSAIKAATFDGFPSRDSSRDDIERAIDLGIAAMRAMREAVGPKIALKLDCHSHFEVDEAIEVAGRLESVDLDWFEEPISPSRVEETEAIRDAIVQRVAGGEMMFGAAGFAPLCRRRAVDVIMPDVMHCGGILEGRDIAALAAVDDIEVSPHNACGPVATAAALQLSAGIENFDGLELQWGEVDWRGDVVEPPERVENGVIVLPEGPGLGVELNDKLLADVRRR